MADRKDTKTHGNVIGIRPWLAVLSVAISAFIVITTEFLPVGLLGPVAADVHVKKVPLQKIGKALSVELQPVYYNSSLPFEKVFAIKPR